MSFDTEISLLTITDADVRILPEWYATTQTYLVPTRMQSSIPQLDSKDDPYNTYMNFKTRIFTSILELPFTPEEEEEAKKYQEGGGNEANFLESMKTLNRESSLKLMDYMMVSFRSELRIVVQAFELVRVVYLNVYTQNVTVGMLMWAMFLAFRDDSIKNGKPYILSRLIVKTQSDGIYVSSIEDK